MRELATILRNESVTVLGSVIYVHSWPGSFNSFSCRNVNFNFLYDLSGTGFKTCETTRCIWSPLKTGTNKWHFAFHLERKATTWTVLEPVMKYSPMVLDSFQSSFLYIWLLEYCSNLSNCCSNCDNSLIHFVTYSIPWQKLTIAKLTNKQTNMLPNYI